MDAISIKIMNAIRYTTISCLAQALFNGAAERKYKNEVEKVVISVADPRIVVRNAGVSTIDARHYGNMDGDRNRKFSHGDFKPDSYLDSFFPNGRGLLGNCSDRNLRTESNGNLWAYRIFVESMAVSRRRSDRLRNADEGSRGLHSRGAILESCEYHLGGRIWCLLAPGRWHPTVRLPACVSRNPNEELGQITEPRRLSLAAGFSN